MASNYRATLAGSVAVEQIQLVRGLQCCSVRVYGHCLLTAVLVCKPPTLELAPATAVACAYHRLTVNI